MDGFLPPAGTPTRPGRQVPGWVHAVSVLAVLVACYAGLSLPALILDAVGRIGPVSMEPALVGAPWMERVSRGSSQRVPLTTAQLADGTRIVLGRPSAVPLQQGTGITLTRSEWTGYPLRVASDRQRIELVPARFGPLWLTGAAAVLALALLVLVWRRHGAGYGMIVIGWLALGCTIGLWTIDQDATPRADGTAVSVTAVA